MTRVLSGLAYAARIGLGLIAGLALLLAAMGGLGHLYRMTAKAPYQLIEVEPGRRLHVACDGPEAAPFVLYDAGAFGIYTDGWWIKDALKDDYRVCLYDRAGMGWSDPVPEGVSPGPLWHVEDMRRLRAALGEDRPFVLIGHSMAGLRLHAYANLHPSELQGLVFVDAARPQSVRAERIQAFIPWVLRAMTIGTGLARIGIAGGMSYLLPDELDLPKQQKQDKRRSIASVKHHKAAKAEIAAAMRVDESPDWMSGSGAETRPVAVYSNSEGGGANASVATAAETNAGFGRIRSLTDETHVSLLNQKNAELIANDVRDMIQGSFVK
ncbi:MAG: alpha/beta fold hydrolase [Pseudomonadota bacterium]